MDKLSVKFAQEAALRQIDECTNIAEIKALAKSLMKAHFEARAFIADLMLRDLPKVADALGNIAPRS